MNILLDTNIIIPLEDTSRILDSSFAELRKLSVEQSHCLYIHPMQLEDINRDKNQERRKIDEVFPAIAKRTVYSYSDLLKILETKTLVILFRYIALDKEISYQQIVKAKVEGYIQSIRKKRLYYPFIQIILKKYYLGRSDTSIASVFLRIYDVLLYMQLRLSK